MRKANDHHARRQKELARKARQLEKQQRRSARAVGADESTPANAGCGRSADRSSLQHRDVKLTLPSSAAVRQERSIRLRRDRAAALAVRAVFPQIRQLRLELRFEGTGANGPVPQSHILHPAARAYFRFSCPHADCDGQFDLTSAVSSAVEDPSHRTEGMVECAGVRPGASCTKRPCQLHLLYAITALYQPGS